MGISLLIQQVITGKTIIADKASKNTLVKVDLMTLEDKQYRLVFKAGSVADADTNKTLKDITFEFIGTEGDDKASDVNVEAGVYTTSTNTIASPTLSKCR